jgi:hypothetical protein
MLQYLKSVAVPFKKMDTHCARCNVPFMFIESESTNVCPQCGLTSTVTTVTSDGYGENVFVCVYSRAKRFEIMLRALLYPSFDKKDTAMYKHLEKHKPFETVASLEECMKLCKMKETRFHSLHLYASLMCTNYKRPTPPTQEYFKRMLRIFDEVLCRFNATHSRKFFSYPWLIRSLLTMTGENRYNKFIKRIRCKKRNAYYIDLLYGLVKNAPKTYFISSVCVPQTSEVDEQKTSNEKVCPAGVSLCPVCTPEESQGVLETTP